MYVISDESSSSEPSSTLPSQTPPKVNPFQGVRPAKFVPGVNGEWEISVYVLY